MLKGEGVLFVCTKKQLKAIVQAEAQRCGAFYVTERWLGGMLTNFQTIKKQIRRLRELEQGAADGDFENYTKKEQLLFERERVKLEPEPRGHQDMGRLPGALFVVDAKKEKIAVAEANKLGHPGRRDRGHQRRPGRDHGADPGQRRRDPLGLADHRRAVGCDQGGPGARCRCARPPRISRPRPTAPTRAARATPTPIGSGAGPRRKRRPKPEAIAARLKTETRGRRRAGTPRRRATPAPKRSRMDHGSIRRSWPVRAASGGLTIQPEMTSRETMASMTIPPKDVASCAPGPAPA